MNREYNLKLDLQFRCNNSTMKFNQFDNNTSDFFMRITNGGNLVDIEKAIVVLAVIKPSGKVASQFVEVKNGLVYADLKPSMKDEIGTYTAQAMLILEDERVVTDVISYEVKEDKIFSLLNDTVETSEEFTLLTDMLSRLSAIEISEEQRMINEAERILSEENRKIEEAKRVEAELIRQHEEADRAKYDATRESNENIRKQNESIRLANETNRIDEEAKRVEEENKRVEAEQLRKDNYNFMTEDEERRRLEANAHKEAEVLRVQAETNRVNEEAKRRTTEQGRISAENTRVSNENTRETNEAARQNNENQRIEAETQRKNRYNSFISDAEANANNFENYTNTAKVKEEERKANELDRKSQENRRVSNEVERISNENTRKANEVVREKNEASRQNTFTNKVNEVDKKIVEMNTAKDNFISSINTKVDNKISEIDKSKSDMTNTVTNKIDEVETRFNALTSKQQQDAEVIDARDGETSLKARLDRDIEKAKQVYVNVEGSNISTDSSSGYAKDVEILGNTIQSASNLADIRSVGDKVEGQELYKIDVVSRGKNLFDGELEPGTYQYNNGVKIPSTTEIRSVHKIKVNPSSNYIISSNKSVGNIGMYYYDSKENFIKAVYDDGQKVVTTEDTHFIAFRFTNSDLDRTVQLEEGTVATPYEPYQEDKLTILSPVQLEKVGDVADRIIEKDGVLGVEKNVVDIILNGSENWFSSRINTNTILFRFGKSLDTLYLDNVYYINTLFKSVRGADSWNNDTECVAITTDKYIDVRISKSRLNTEDVNGFKDYLKNNPVTIKYPITNPQFIPLPHDQQIKLRTFANKTNISFLTEIEGTIKAQVPKSLGATVNTHTEQINNLNKELNRVKKLEESTVSTVTTESDFTTVEQTSNGYFEDVKLEGKTLVNLSNLPSGDITLNNRVGNAHITPLKQLTSSDTLYLTFNCTSIDSDATLGIIYSVSYKDGTPSDYKTIEYDKTVGYKKVKIIPKSDIQHISIYLHGDNSSSASATISDVMLMYEKDYDAQNPPSYFEGLKSVGQSATTSEDGVDEIVVSSVKGDGNLIDLNISNLDVSSSVCNLKLYENNSMSWHINSWSNWKITQTINVKKNTEYYLNVSVISACNIQIYDSLTKEVLCTLDSKSLKFTSKSNSIIIEYRANNIDTPCVLEGVSITASGISYTPHQSDKKRLLYYNEETQTWEKPILREWDSVEKHSDGKYYYHQRSAEVVLNGSENWNSLTLSASGLEAYAGFGTPIENGKVTLIGSNYVIDTHGFANQELDTINNNGYLSEALAIHVNGNLYIRILKSKLPTQDAQGFKQWLQANNVTVVYQLAQEKVYECTNIDLITYANETNYVINSGAIVPRTTLKVHNNISNVVSLLQKKVSLLESNIKLSQEVQDMMILETDMRMLDIELALMDFMPMTLNLGGSNMLRSATYFNFLKNHIINETYEKEYLENVMNKYLATGRINQDEYNELYKMLYPPVYDIELPIEY